MLRTIEFRTNIKLRKHPGGIRGNFRGTVKLHVEPPAAGIAAVVIEIVPLAMAMMPRKSRSI
jgi:hypothetical protein